MYKSFSYEVFRIALVWILLPIRESGIDLTQTAFASACDRCRFSFQFEARFFTFLLVFT